MLNFSKVDFKLAQIIGDVRLILIGAKPTYEYVNGKRTDKVLGTTYTVVENGGTYEKFNVKTPEIENAIDSDYIASNTQIFVEFENAICKLYTDANGRIQVSVKADAINIVG